MGRRKERRLAAKSNAGRRVKLDLFAEPSGDLGGSSAHNEVEENSKRDDGLPNSPSSSGQQPQNPLLLLGQYTDDETDKDPGRNADKALGESLLANDDDQVKQVHKRGYEGERSAEDVVVQNLREDFNNSHHLEGWEGSGFEESRASALGNLHEEIAEGDPQLDAKISSSLAQDVFAGWKMVMHEETGQYYYWNVDTGETSWEVPAILAQMTEASKDQMYSGVEATEDQPIGTHESVSVPAFDVEANAVSAGLSYNGSVGACLASTGRKSDDCVAAVGQMTAEQESGKDNYLENDVKGCIPSSKSTLDSRLFAGRKDSVEDKDNLSWVEQSSQLIKRSESLLERLKSLQCSTYILLGHDWISRYILEIQIRLSDMRSLSLYGSILRPFWEHSEKQIQQLESAVKVEICQSSKPEPDDATKETDVPLARESGKFIDCKEPEFEVNQMGSVPVVSKAENASVSPEVVVSSNADQTAAHHMKDGDADCSRSDIEEGELIDSATIPEASTPKPALDDVDMDIDMEVEDLTLVDSSAILKAGVTETSGSPEKLGEPNLLPECPLHVSEHGTSVPPPPDEEWIPPPPPDGEQIPPPPPDDPCPPLVADTLGHPLPYADHYNYPNSNYLYGHGETSVNFYGHAGGGQVALEHGSVLFGAVLHSYTDMGTVVALGPAASGVNAVEASQFQSVSGSSSYSTLPSSEIPSVPALAQGGSSALFPQTDVNTVKESADTPSTSSAIMSAIIRASATTSVKETVPVSSSTSTSVVTSTASIDAKTQSKVLRSKKRTLAVAPTLRSNKKVSSLVDKWKAAKEELQEDEENEEKNALAILERKRQKEIEEWHAQQIASGEAKDNANFQPLGGDWRERVKRRRAQAAAEAVQSQEATNGGTQQKPNLVELGRGLPSGWQAYWDESSKQVYYGNLITSETTWTRPTKS